MILTKTMLTQQAATVEPVPHSLSPLALGDAYRGKGEGMVVGTGRGTGRNDQLMLFTMGARTQNEH